MVGKGSFQRLVRPRESGDYLFRLGVLWLLRVGISAILVSTSVHAVNQSMAVTVWLSSLGFVSGNDGRNVTHRMFDFEVSRWMDVSHSLLELAYVTEFHGDYDRPYLVRKKLSATSLLESNEIKAEVSSADVRSLLLKHAEKVANQLEQDLGPSPEFVRDIYSLHLNRPDLGEKYENQIDTFRPENNLVGMIAITTQYPYAIESLVVVILLWILPFELARPMLRRHFVHCPRCGCNLKNTNACERCGLVRRKL